MCDFFFLSFFANSVSDQISFMWKVSLLFLFFTYNVLFFTKKIILFLSLQICRKRFLSNRISKDLCQLIHMPTNHKLNAIYSCIKTQQTRRSAHYRSPHVLRVGISFCPRKTITVFKRMRPFKTSTISPSLIIKKNGKKKKIKSSF